MAQPFTVMLPSGGSMTVNADSPEAARINAGVGPSATVIAGGHQTVQSGNNTIVNPDAHVGAGEVGRAPNAGGGSGAISYGTAADGQALSNQSAETQAAFNAAYGAAYAPQAWAAQHNTDMGVASDAPPNSVRADLGAGVRTLTPGQTQTSAATTATGGVPTRDQAIKQRAAELIKAGYTTDQAYAERTAGQEYDNGSLQSGQVQYGTAVSFKAASPAAPAAGAATAPAAAPAAAGGSPAAGTSTDPALAAYFESISGFDRDQLAQQDAQFQQSLQLQKDQMEKLGIPQLQIQQKLADMEDQHFKQQLALAQQAQNFNQGLQTADLTGNYNGTPTEQAKEFSQNMSLAQAQQALNEKVQTGQLTLAQAQQQLAQLQNSQQYGLQQQQMTLAQQAQNWNQGMDTQQLNAARYQFDQTLNQVQIPEVQQAWQQLKQQQDQFQASLAQNQGQFNSSLDLQNRQLQQAQAQFNQTLQQVQIPQVQQAWQQLKQQQDQFNASLAQNNQQFQQSFGLNQAAVTGTYNGQQTQAAQNQAFQQQLATAQQALAEKVQTGQLSIAQAQQQLAELSNSQQFGLAQAGVTGTYNGQQTEQAREFNANQGLQYLTQASQFAASDPFALSDFMRGAQGNAAVPQFVSNLQQNVGGYGAQASSAGPAASSVGPSAGSVGPPQQAAQANTPGAITMDSLSNNLAQGTDPYGGRADATLNAIGGIYSQGADKLAAGSLEGLDSNEMTTLNQGINKVGGSLAGPAFLEKYKRNPIRSQSLGGATALAY